MSINRPIVCTTVLMALLSAITLMAASNTTVQAKPIKAEQPVPAAVRHYTSASSLITARLGDMRLKMALLPLLEAPVIRDSVYLPCVHLLCNANRSRSPPV